MTLICGRCDNNNAIKTTNICCCNQPAVHLQCVGVEGVEAGRVGQQQYVQTQYPHNA